MTPTHHDGAHRPAAHHHARARNLQGVSRRRHRKGCTYAVRLMGRVLPTGKYRIPNRLHGLWIGTDEEAAELERAYLEIARTITPQPT